MKHLTSVCNRENHSRYLVRGFFKGGTGKLNLSFLVRRITNFRIYSIKKTHFSQVLRLASSHTWPGNASPKTSATYPGVRCRCHSPDRRSPRGLPKNLTTLAWAKINAAVCGFVASVTLLHLSRQFSRDLQLCKKNRQLGEYN
jgi:hypothetical protein